MKKLLLASAVLIAFVGLVCSEMYKVPTANTDQPASVWYGGVEYATSAFSSALATVTTSGGAVLYGVQFSTGNAADIDFVDVWDATGAWNFSTDNTWQKPTIRLYNVERSSTVGGVEITTEQGFTGPRYPIRMKNGLLFRPSRVNYQSILLLYWKQD